MSQILGSYRFSHDIFIYRFEHFVMPTLTLTMKIDIHWCTPGIQTHNLRIESRDIFHWASQHDLIGGAKIPFIGKHDRENFSAV